MSPDRRLLATRFRRGLHRPANDGGGVPGPGERHAAAVDTVGRPAEESRRDIRTGRSGARLRGRRRADGAFRSVRSRGGRGGPQKRARLGLRHSAVNHERPPTIVHARNLYTPRPHFCH